MLTVTKL